MQEYEKKKTNKKIKNFLFSLEKALTIPKKYGIVI